MRFIVTFCIVGLAAARSPAAETPNAALAAQAATILERHCVMCHRGAGSASKAKFDVRSVPSMIEAGVVIAGDLKSSLLWDLAQRGTMPPRSQPQLSRLTAAEAKVVADWIQGGAAEFPVPTVRAPTGLADTLQAIAADLRKLPDGPTRSRQRYFSLVEAYNNRAISNESLHVLRAALVKAINSLSWQPDIVQPRVIDEQHTLFAIDLEQLGWTRKHWLAVRQAYPYTVGFANLSDRKLSQLEEEILRLTERREPLYMVRGDWFVVTALQPGLYHVLLYDLDLPELSKRLPDNSQPANPQQMTARDLEQFLQVDVIADIQRGGDRAMRCGFTPSGVSGQNRLIERHRTKFGAYWKSYDFKANNRRAILSQFPLGPAFAGNQSAPLAFEHDGGEIIFNLPNGLQAYLLVDGKDRRIDAGPIEVVSDALKTSGTPAIVNGLSCMSCHKKGMINPPADEIREFSRVFGQSHEHVQRLYPPTEVFLEKVEADADLFQRALEKTIGPILKRASEAGPGVGEFPEPVSDVARNYLQEELDLHAVAAELHEPDVRRVAAKIENDELLQELGLGVLIRPDGKIKRAFWESRQGGASVMQLTASALGYTTPLHPK